MADQIITRIDLIEQLARKRGRSNIQFRTWLKRSDLSDQEVDATVHMISEEVAAQVDCTACGNCCRTMQVVVDDADIRRLAKSLIIDAKELERRYVRTAKGGGKHFATAPCPFLEGNRCSVYEDRPKACRDFPYLHVRGFRQRTLLMIDNTAICPIVFHTYERLKTESGFKRRE